MSVFVQGSPDEGSAGAPVLYLHGVPTSSDDWRPFLARTGGLAVDLPGFGRSAKRGDFDYSIGGYGRFVEQLLAALAIDRVRLVMHDWGVVGLAFAQRHPGRVERLVVIDGVPLLPGYRWHAIARIWRRPVLGELFMGATTRWAARVVMRGSGAIPRRPADPQMVVSDEGAPMDFVSSWWRHFDHGTQRAILRLYRSAPANALAAAGEGLSRVVAPALVLWGDRDPYMSPTLGEQYAETFPHARLVRVPDAGHWPWLDRPELVEEVASFLASGAGATSLG
jgi:pimeloyl-ACP methyl ester carboxylesterase